MFDALSDRLGTVFDRLRGRGALSEQDVRDAMREVRIALLEADVALPVVRRFIDEVTEKAVGQNVLRSVTPGQQVVKIVNDAIVDMLGGEDVPGLDLNAAPPVVILMVGLQGSGKTTTTAKLGKLLKEKFGKKALMASLDVNRPAAQEQLKVLGLTRGIFPILDAVLAPDGSLPEGMHGAFVKLALQDTDLRVSEGRSVAPSFLLACLLWFDVKARWQALRAKGEPTVPALQQAIDQVFDARVGDISGRGKLAADMREVWLMQPRFERRSGSGPYSLADQPRYRAGFDFLRLRADVGDADGALADWWEDFALGDEEERRALIEDARAHDHRAVLRHALELRGGHGEDQAIDTPVGARA